MDAILLQTLIDRRLPRADLGNVGITITAQPEDIEQLTKLLNDYFRLFAAPVGEDKEIAGYNFRRVKCLCCGAYLTGIFGVFQWGIVSGEGFCGTCGYPCRAIHFIPDGDNPEVVLDQLVLQYHPEEVELKVKPLEGQ